jgi:hypothetical protein
VKLTRFTGSPKFTACLGVVGDLDLPNIEHRPDPEAPGVAPQVLIGMLAGLWLTPITVLLSVLVMGAEPPATVEPARPAVSTFDPEMAPAPEATPEPSPAQSSRPAQPPAGSLSGPGAVEGMLDLARRHKDREEYDKALRVLQDLIEIDIENAEAHYLLAWTWIGLGERENALAEFRATVNLTDPEDEMHQEALAALERMQ